MFKLKKITFGYHEGRHDHWSSPKGNSYATLASANAAVRVLADNQAKDLLGCLKTDITLEWEDGQTYEARYETKGSGNARIEDHVRDHLLFCAGKQCQPNMTDEEYRLYLSRMRKYIDQKASAEFLEKYSLEDQPTTEVPVEFDRPE